MYKNRHLQMGIYIKNICLDVEEKFYDSWKH